MVILFSAAGLYLLFLYKVSEDLGKWDCNYRRSRHYVLFNSLKDTIFIEASNVGWSSSNDYIYVSSNRISQPANLHYCIVYHQTEIYYKKNNDTLEILTDYIKEIPKGFRTKIFVKQTRIENDEQRLMNKSYDSLGYYKVSVYDSIDYIH